MSILARVGERLYEFDSEADVSIARELYCRCKGSQNDFEERMEDEGLDFFIEDPEHI